MLTPPRRVYPGSFGNTWVFFDTEDTEACALLHKLRATHRGRSDVEALDDRYYVLFVPASDEPGSPR